MVLSEVRSFWCQVQGLTIEAQALSLQLLPDPHCPLDVAHLVILGQVDLVLLHRGENPDLGERPDSLGTVQDPLDVALLLSSCSKLHRVGDPLLEAMELGDVPDCPERVLRDQVDHGPPSLAP